MQRRTQLVVAVMLAIAVAGAGTYAVVTSRAPAPATCPSTSTIARVDFRATGSSVSESGSAPSHADLTVGRTGIPPLSSEHRGPVHEVRSTGVIQVVAAENFWGSLVSQLGGNATSVLSIVTDPNADPHEYEANTSNAVAISNAQFVIVNGVGYDEWALNLISADGNPHQFILNVGDLNGVLVGGGVVSGNPHMWYNPPYVNRTVAAMFSDLVSLDPAARGSFQANYAAMNVTLGELYGRAALIKHQFAGTVVAATEDIFVYLANYTGLDLISPPEFMQAVAEGNDPPTQSVVEFQCQLESGNVRVLVYNEQTVTPVTANLKVIATEHNVTVVGVTETIQPPGVDFQTWMNAEYLSLQNALNPNLGK